MTNVSKAMEYATTFEREAMREKLDAALGDLKHMNFQELEARVLHHAQQIKDIAKHLLELKRLVTPPMIMDDDDLNNVRYKANYRYETKWVGLTGDEIEDLPKGGTWGEVIRAAEAILREKNT